jgi:hypothetical protein
MMAGTPTNKQNEKKQRPKTRSKRGADDDDEEAEGRLVVCAGGAGETIDYRRQD